MKRIAPIVITIIICGFIVLWAASGFLFGLFGTRNIALGLIFLIPGLCAIAALIAALISRMKEIDQEDEDELKKY